MPIRRQVTLKFGRCDPGQHAGPKRTFFDGLRWLGRRNDLASLPAAWTGIRVSHVLDDIRLCLLQFELLGDVRLDYNAILTTASARQLMLFEWIVLTANGQKIREHEFTPRFPPRIGRRL